MTEVEEAVDVLFAHRWKDERADDREADLAAVGVAGEHEVDEREAWVLDYRIDEVWFVAHENDGRFRVGRNGQFKVTGRGAGVAGAG